MAREPQAALATASGVWPGLVNQRMGFPGPTNGQRSSKDKWPDGATVVLSLGPDLGTGPDTAGWTPLWAGTSLLARTLLELGSTAQLTSTVGWTPPRTGLTQLASPQQAWCPGPTGFPWAHLGQGRGWREELGLLEGPYRGSMGSPITLPQPLHSPGSRPWRSGRRPPPRGS